MKKSLLAVLVVILVGCAGTPTQYRVSCDTELDTAWKELDIIEAEGFSGTVSYSKAFSLITAAKTLQTVEKFEACFNQAKKARFYIAESKAGR